MMQQENMNEVLCDCAGVTRGKIYQLVVEGYDNLDAISRRTGAVSGCGGCEWDIADLLKALQAD